MKIRVFTGENLSPITLNPAGKHQRDRARPEEYRDANYDKLYDFHNIFFDAFMRDGGKEIWLVGPKLFNFEKPIKNGRVVALIDGEEQELTFEIQHRKKVAYLKARLVEPVTEPPILKLDFGELGNFQVQVQSNEQAFFAGLRTVLTMFKYEPLEWVRDWAEYNVRYHGAEAFLIYNNHCPHATSPQIAEALSDVEGIKSLLVVDWFYPYGPQSVGMDFWDSTFCQVGMLEQARWRLLSDAKSVLNTDIDELIVTEGHQSIFEIVENCPEKYILFGGYWTCTNGKAQPIEKRRHRQFLYKDVAETSTNPVEQKWAVVPSVLGEDEHWLVHRIRPYKGQEPMPDKVGIRHFKDINTKWKLERKSNSGEVCFDESLSCAFEKVGWVKPALSQRLMRYLFSR